MDHVSNSERELFEALELGLFFGAFGGHEVRGGWRVDFAGWLQWLGVLGINIASLLP